VLGRLLRDVRVVTTGAAIMGSRPLGVGVGPRWRYDNDEMLSSNVVAPAMSMAPYQHRYTSHGLNIESNYNYFLATLETMSQQ